MRRAPLPRSVVLTGLAAAALLLLTTVGCSASSSDSRSGARGTAAAAGRGPEGTDSVAAIDTTVQVTEIAEADSPVAFTARPGSSNLYVAEQAGRIVAIRSNRGNAVGATVDPGDFEVQGCCVLDLTDEVGSGGERGLLGIAFSPDGQELYTYFTGQDGTIHVVRFEMRGDEVDTGSRRDLLSLPHQRPNHNGGQLQVDGDGFLYVAVGDGGGGGDPDKNGQNPDSLYGKILRIDPEHPADGKPYGIPPGNPFADGSRGSPETWVYGARNPWRFSFDRQTGDLWIGDVGQDAYEEIDFLPRRDDGAGRGANLGWREMEGTHPYKDGEAPPGATGPILDYGQDEGGCSVIAGYVSRGRADPRLTGVFLYADYCIGKLRGLLQRDGALVADADLGAEVPHISTFGQDNDGLLYAVSQEGKIYAISQS